ncbi:uncharacterized protein RSE6_00849 [Rhynchosporium secalis]|uniref:Uncharacterized protein n=1 Tax=Rhynchosporium secalis TaxID=38038 RepID=A0A1E1LWA5_RHYSE|nr:uncharacterized protein RSE6_00849 [Rhynchosporium secalis]
MKLPSLIILAMTAIPMASAYPGKDVLSRNAEGTLEKRAHVLVMLAITAVVQMGTLKETVPKTRVEKVMRLPERRAS